MQWDILDSIEAHIKYGSSLAEKLGKSSQNDSLLKTISDHSSAKEKLLQKTEIWKEHLRQIDRNLLKADELRDEKMYEDLKSELSSYLENVSRLEEFL